MTDSSNRKIARAAGAVSIAIMCSRVLGLIREQIFAGFFGAGFAYDSFVVAFRIPNLLRDLFGEGALSAAFVTVFSAYDAKKSQQETWQLASNVLTFFLVMLSLLTLLAIYFTEPIVSLLAPDFSLILGKVALTEKLTRIMLPFMVFISLSAVVMGMLNTKGKFFIPALASSFFNLGSIIGGVGFALILPKFDQPPIVGMAVGTLIGGICQLVIQLPTLHHTGFRYRPQLNLADNGLKQILTLMLPATVGLSATQLNIFVNTNFAASCAEGSVSWLYYAFRLVQLPIGVFGVALSIAILPMLAKQAANKQISAIKETMVSSLIMVFALALPATTGLIFLAQPIIRLIFEHGAFTPTDTIATANTLIFYAIGLFAYSANKILVPVFYALGKTRYPVIASFLTVGLNIVIISFTIEKYQHLAIAFSTSCTMIINFFFLMTILYIKLGGFSLSYLLKGLGKIGCTTSIMAGVLVLMRNYCQPWFTGAFIWQTLGLSISIGCAGLFYLVILSFLRLPELQIIINKIYQKTGRVEKSS